MIHYLTFNDGPSGVYFSQVTEVCRYLSELSGRRVRLLAFISLRGYFRNRRKIRQAYADALVVPMIPGLARWNWNVHVLSLLVRKGSSLICRGPMAAALGIMVKKQGRASSVCYDARGAFDAEVEEYRMVPEEIKHAFSGIEKTAVTESDFRLAISEKLVGYWKIRFGYEGHSHVIIPCLLNGRAGRHLPPMHETESRRGSLGFGVNDIVVVFSGSNSRWHSLDMVIRLLSGLMARNHSVKLLLLTPELPDNDGLFRDFKDRVVHTWLPPDQVYLALCLADYGILLREDTVTNRVASPVKFAEYLRAGLPVILSPCIGDFSDWAVRNNCAILADENESWDLDARPLYEEKRRLHDLAMEKLTHDAFRNEYLKVIGGN